MVAIAIMLLAVVDVLATGYGVAQGYVTEMNPLFAVAFGWSLKWSLITAVIANALAVTALVCVSTRRAYMRHVMWAMLTVRVLPVVVHLHWLRLAGYIPT